MLRSWNSPYWDFHFQLVIYTADIGIWVRIQVLFVYKELITSHVTFCLFGFTRYFRNDGWILHVKIWAIRDKNVLNLVHQFYPHRILHFALAWSILSLSFNLTSVYLIYYWHIVLLHSPMCVFVRVCRCVRALVCVCVYACMWRLNSLQT